MTILVTGSAGFIGFHLCRRLLELDQKIIGIDNFNSYYDVNLKEARSKILLNESNYNEDIFSLQRVDICNKDNLNRVFDKFRPDYVVHLAAQPGVRYALDNPGSYINNNLVGFGNILENCKQYKTKHLIFASSSAVYGGNINTPFKENQNVDHPVSLYAATKKSNELMAHAYSNLYGLPCTGIRFFTVYGPWGRPDMALSLFIKAMLDDKEINVNGNGKMERDFTYIDDVVEGLIRLINKIPRKNDALSKKYLTPYESWCPYKIFNMGNSNKILLSKYIEVLEKNLGFEAKKIFHPVQPGEMFKTESNNELLEEWIKFKPETSIDYGIKKFINWYKDYYKK